MKHTSTLFALLAFLMSLVIIATVTIEPTPNTPDCQKEPTQ